MPGVIYKVPPAVPTAEIVTAVGSGVTIQCEFGAITNEAVEPAVAVMAAVPMATEMNGVPTFCNRS